jgi:hypothetical protein
MHTIPTSNDSETTSDDGMMCVDAVSASDTKAAEVFRAHGCSK